MRGQYFSWSEYHWSPSQFLLLTLIVPLNTDEPPVRININKSQHKNPPDTTEMVSHGDGLNSQRRGVPHPTGPQKCRGVLCLLLAGSLWHMIIADSAVIPFVYVCVLYLMSIACRKWLVSRQNKDLHFICRIIGQALVVHTSDG